MPKPNKIQEEKVFLAANAIAARGEAPTNEKVIAELGGGSKSTIGPVMRKWRDIHSPNVTSAVMLPPELQVMLVAYFKKVEADARNEAQAELNESLAIEKELRTEHEQKEAELEEVVNELEQSRRALAVAEGRASQLALDLAEVRNQLAREQASNQTLNMELAKAILRLEGLPRLETELKDCRDTLAKEREARAAAETDAAVAREKANGLESRLMDYRTEISKKP